MPRGHGTLERQSTQSALSIRQWAFYTMPPHIKKTAALRFVFKILWKVRIITHEHKTTAFQVC